MSERTDVRVLGRVVASVLLAAGEASPDEIARANAALSVFNRPALGQADLRSRRRTMEPLLYERRCTRDRCCRQPAAAAGALDDGARFCPEPAPYDNASRGIRRSQPSGDRRD